MTSTIDGVDSSRHQSPVQKGNADASAPDPQAQPVAIVGVNGDTFKLARYLPPGTPLYASPVSAPDRELLDFLRDESLDLRCFDMPTGAGDADIGWRVIQHHMAKPHEREVGVAYRDDPREAIRNAIAALRARIQQEGAK